MHDIHHNRSTLSCYLIHIFILFGRSISPFVIRTLDGVINFINQKTPWLEIKRQKHKIINLKTPILFHSCCQIHKVLFYPSPPTHLINLP